MSKENLKETYHNLKKEFFSQGIVVGTKSKVFDFVVFNLKYDAYVKIVKPTDMAHIDELIGYMKGFIRKRRYLSSRYILIFLDDDYKENTRREIILK